MDFGNGERALAYTVRINSIRPHSDPSRTRIEVAQINGWQCIVRKGEFSPGDVAVFCEIDSFVPHELAPFLTKAGAVPGIYKGVSGERLKTLRIHGELSQGLLLSVNAVLGEEVPPGVDVTKRLGILKWEDDRFSACGSPYPAFIPKTDAERLQNISDAELREMFATNTLYYGWHISEKLDGTSTTFYLRDNKFHVCTRNRQVDGYVLGMPQCEFVKRFPIHEYMVKHRLNGYALQGELVGPGIQGNPYNLEAMSFFLFGIYDINNQRYANIADFGLPDIRTEKAEFHVLKEVNYEQPEADDVDIRSHLESICDINWVEHYLDSAFIVHEGVVFKSAMHSKWLKLISNNYLMDKKSSCKAKSLKTLRAEKRDISLVVEDMEGACAYDRVEHEVMESAHMGEVMNEMHTMERN